MLDSALFIWAAIERCGKSGTKGELVCSIDVSNVIKSVSAIIKFIIKSVDECSTIKDINHKCAATAFELTEAVGGLAGASAAIAAKCPAKAPAPAPKPPAPAPTPPAPAPTPTCADFVCEAPMTLRFAPEGLDCVGACTADTCCLVPERGLGELAGTDSSRRLVSKTHFRAATCAIEVKSSMKAMAKAVVNIMEVQKSCGDSTNWDCTNSGLSLISAFSSMATYIMGAVGHCSRIQFDLGIGCASAVTDIIGKLLDVSKASNSLGSECGADEAAPAPAPKPTVLVPTPTPVPQPAPTILVPTPVPTPVTAQPTILVPTPVPTPVPAPRLYAKDGSRAPRRASRNAAFANALKDNGPVTFTLAALLPITAIAAFFGGSRLAR